METRGNAPVFVFYLKLFKKFHIKYYYPAEIAGKVGIL
jgi:hypothetical protein